MIEALSAERWLSVEEVCEHLGIKRDTIYRLARDEGLPAHRVGKFLRFKASQVDQWVENGPSHVGGQCGKHPASGAAQ